MLIRLIKLAGFLLFKLTMWFGIPIGKLLYKLTWKGTPAEFALALFEDPDITEVATNAGMLHVLELYKQKCLAIVNAPKPPTEEDRMWAEFITHYGENPQPDIVPEYFRYLIRGGTTGTTVLPTAGALVALCRKHRDLHSEWQKTPEFLALFKKALEWQTTEASRRGWNDFFMAQWFILRDDAIAATIARRAHLPGMTGATCRWMANSVAQQMPAFREALERAGYDFPPIDLAAAVPPPRTGTQHYPMNQDAANEFLGTLAGARILSAEMNETGEGNEIEEHIAIKTDAGQFCLSAPELSMHWKAAEQKEEPC